MNDTITNMDELTDAFVDISEEIRIPTSRSVMRDFMKSIGETLVHTCELLTERHPDHPITVQNLNNKLTRDSIRFREVIEIADVHGYSVCFQKKGNGNIVIGNKFSRHEEPRNSTTLPENVMNRIQEGYTAIHGINFETVLIVGENFHLAEQALTPMLQSKKIDRSSKGAVTELGIYANVQGLFDVICYPSSQAV